MKKTLIAIAALATWPLPAAAQSPIASLVESTVTVPGKRGRVKSMTINRIGDRYLVMGQMHGDNGKSGDRFSGGFTGAKLSTWTERRSEGIGLNRSPQYAVHEIDVRFSGGLRRAGFSSVKVEIGPLPGTQQFEAAAIRTDGNGYASYVRTCLLHLLWGRASRVKFTDHRESTSMRKRHSVRCDY